MSEYAVYREQIVDTARLLVDKGYLMATGGNISIRILEKKAIAITPSNMDYKEMTPEDVSVLDFDLNPLESTRDHSVESALHAGIYKVRLDVNVIIHTHQVYAGALSVINMPIPALFDEQARFLGRSVEIIPYAPSGTGLLKHLVVKYAKKKNNAYMMRNHGVLCFGHDLTRAMHNVEIFEKCSIAYLLALCSDKKISKIPLAVREIAFRKLREDQKKVTRGDLPTSGE